MRRSSRPDSGGRRPGARQIEPTSRWHGVRGHAWEQLTLPRIVRRTGGRCCGARATGGRITARRQVAVIHDIAPLTQPSTSRPPTEGSRVSSPDRSSAAPQRSRLPRAVCVSELLERFALAQTMCSSSRRASGRRSHRSRSTISSGGPDGTACTSAPTIPRKNADFLLDALAGGPHAHRARAPRHAQSRSRRAVRPAGARGPIRRGHRARGSHRRRAGAPLRRRALPPLAEPLRGVRVPVAGGDGDGDSVSRHRRRCGGRARGRSGRADPPTRPRCLDPAHRGVEPDGRRPASPGIGRAGAGTHLGRGRPRGRPGCSTSCPAPPERSTLDLPPPRGSASSEACRVVLPSPAWRQLWLVSVPVSAGAAGAAPPAAPFPSPGNVTSCAECFQGASAAARGSRLQAGGPGADRSWSRSTRPRKPGARPVPGHDRDRDPANAGVARLSPTARHRPVPGRLPRRRRPPRSPNVPVPNPTPAIRARLGRRRRRSRRRRPPKLRARAGS